MNIQFIVSYEGTHYRGWQRQGNTDQTIQGTLEALFTRFYETPVDIRASGRTDRGVHAIGQVINVELPVTSEPALQKDLAKLNQFLPQDLRLTRARIVEDRFHSRLNARWKHYRYQIAEGIALPLYRRFETSIETPLDLDLMREGCQALVGTHDFANLSDVKPSKKSSTRTLYKIDLHSEDRIGGRLITIDVYGDGFLYHMVRYMVGTLIQIGQGEADLSTLVTLLDPQQQSRPSFLAPAEGLILVKVSYTDWPDHDPS